MTVTDSTANKIARIIVAIEMLNKNGSYLVPFGSIAAIDEAANIQQWKHSELI